MQVTIKIGKPIRIIAGDEPSGFVNYPTLTDYSSTAVLDTEWEFTATRGSSLDTLVMVLDDPDNDIDIQQGYDIFIEETNKETNRLFAGVIVQIEMASFGIGRRLRITAQDWTVLLDKTIVRKIYETSGQTDKSIIQDAFMFDPDNREHKDGLPEINTSDVRQTRAINHPLSFQNVSLASVLNTVSDIAGAVWFVDPFKRLQYRPLASQYGASNFVYSDSPDLSANFPKVPYYNLRVSKDLAEWNVVDIVGITGLSADKTEIYAGDASQTIFVTGAAQQNDRFPISYAPATPVVDAISGVTANPDAPSIELNTGTQGTPIWTVQDVRIALADDEGAGDVKWTALSRMLEFDTAPLNGSNGFRITGRYQSSKISTTADTRAISRHGRRFRGAVNVPETIKSNQAATLALAFLRDHSDRVVLSFTTNYDFPKVGDISKMTHTAFGITDQAILINRVTTRMLGGTTTEYDVEAELVNRDLYSEDKFG